MLGIFVLGVGRNLYGVIVAFDVRVVGVPDGIRLRTSNYVYTF